MNNHEMKAQSRESYETLRQLADELEQFCKDMEAQLTVLTNQTTTLQSSFDGDIYNTFRDKIEEKIANVREKLAALRQIREKLESKADELETATSALRELGLLD